MEEAVPAGVGTMAAVLGMEREELLKVTEEVSQGGDSVQLANLNCPGQIVISGTKKASKQLENWPRNVELKESFHCK